MHIIYTKEEDGRSKDGVDLNLSCGEPPPAGVGAAAPDGVVGGGRIISAPVRGAHSRAAHPKGAHPVGCEEKLLKWLRSSADILFILGYCVCGFLKLCFLGILRLVTPHLSVFLG